MIPKSGTFQASGIQDHGQVGWMPHLPTLPTGRQAVGRPSCCRGGELHSCQVAHERVETFLTMISQRTSESRC